MAKLVVFSGPPGVGKSTLSYKLAQKTLWTLLTKDRIDRSLEREGIVDGRAGYEVLFGLTQLNLQNKNSVILDAVFTTDLLRDSITEIAKATNAEIYYIVCTCSNEEEWKKRIESRPEVVEGWTPADWKEVQRVQEVYAKWGKHHLSLDAMDDLNDNFQKLLTYIDLR